MEQNDRRPVKRAYLAATAIIVVLILALPTISAAVCNTYYNSRVVIRRGEVYCGSEGGTCTECYTIGGSSSNSCWTDGSLTVCEDANGGFRLY